VALTLGILGIFNRVGALVGIAGGLGARIAGCPLGANGSFAAFFMGSIKARPISRSALAFASTTSWLMALVAFSESGGASRRSSDKDTPHASQEALAKEFSGSWVLRKADATTRPKSVSRRELLEDATLLRFYG